MKPALIFAVALLGGCAPGASPLVHDREPLSSVQVPQDSASCQRAGGVMRPAGRMQIRQCILTYADAGKSCTSGSQCAGDCRAPSGTDAVPGREMAGSCQATSDRFGCSTSIEKGRVLSTICVD